MVSEVTIVEVTSHVGERGPTGYGDSGLAIDLGTKTGALDLSTYALAGQVFRLTTSGNLTLAVAQMPTVPLNTVGSFSLRILQGATPRTLTLDAAIKASWGNDPALTATAGAIDLFSFFWTGVEWLAMPMAMAIA